MISANETHSTTTTTTPSKGLTPEVFSGYSQQAYLQNPNMPSQSPLQHIWIVTGPAGSGKTTVAKNLQAEMGLPFLEGDDFHPASNKEKMANGVPLTDADRWDWLISLRDAAVDILSKPVDPSSSSSSSTTSSPLSAWRQMQNTRNKSEASSRPSGVIMSCSALKLKYRDVIRVAEYYNPSLRIHFIYLKADEKTLMERVNGRSSHYMKGNMLHSQFEALEDPSDEVDVLAVDVSAPRDVVQRKVSEVVAKKLAEYN